MVTNILYKHPIDALCLAVLFFWGKYPEMNFEMMAAETACWDMSIFGLANIKKLAKFQ